MGKVDPKSLGWDYESSSETFQPMKKQKPVWESRQDKQRDKSFKSHKRQYPKKWDN